MDTIAGEEEPADRPAESRRPPSLRRRYWTRVFVALLLASLYLVTKRWREKEQARSSGTKFTPYEIAGAISLAASLVYLIPRIGEIFD